MSTAEPAAGPGHVSCRCGIVVLSQIGRDQSSGEVGARSDELRALVMLPPRGVMNAAPAAPSTNDE